MCEDHDPDRLERLISRRLDGCIEPAEEAELEAMLASSPQARRVWRVTVAVDGLAGEALQHAAGSGPKWSGTFEARIPPPGRRWRQRAAFWGSVGVAAAVTLVAVAYFGGGRSAMVAEAQHPGGSSTQVASAAVEVAPPEVIRRLTRPARHRSRIEVGQVGIIEGNRVYLMSLDRNRAAARLVRGEL